jgi:hypothetical protein
MTPDEARAVIFAFPGVEEVFSQGSANFKVNGKSLTRLGVRTGPGDLMLNDVDFDEAEMLIAAEPAVFHITPHFAGARCVLARIGALEPDVLRGFLERRWRRIAPKAAVKAWDALGGASAPGGSSRPAP